MLVHICPQDLRPGDRVVGPDGRDAFVVHGVEQSQGRVHVIDSHGHAHSYPTRETLGVQRR